DRVGRGRKQSRVRGDADDQSRLLHEWKHEHFRLPDRQPDGTDRGRQHHSGQVQRRRGDHDVGWPHGRQSLRHELESDLPHGERMHGDGQRWRPTTTSTTSTTSSTTTTQPATSTTTSTTSTTTTQPSITTTTSSTRTTIPGNTCPLGQGFCKNHPSAWLVRT